MEACIFNYCYIELTFANTRISGTWKQVKVDDFIFSYYKCKKNVKSFVGDKKLCKILKLQMRKTATYVRIWNCNLFFESRDVFRVISKV